MDPSYIVVLREMDKHETNVLFDHTRRLRSGELRTSIDKSPDLPRRRQNRRRHVELLKGQAKIDEKTRSDLAEKGFTKLQIKTVMRKGRRYMHDTLLAVGFTKSQIEAIMDKTKRNELSSSVPIRARTNAESDNSEDSDSGSEIEGPVIWFQKSWSVQPDKSHGSQDITTSHFTKQAPIVQIGIPHRTTEQAESETVQPPSHHRARSWRHNLVVASIQPEPELKQVVHATYGDILEDGPDESLYLPGYVALPQSSKLRGDALYHIW